MKLTEYRCPAQRFRRCGLSSFVDASALTGMPVCSVCNAVMIRWPSHLFPKETTIIYEQ